MMVEDAVVVRVVVSVVVVVGVVVAVVLGEVDAVVVRVVDLVEVRELVGVVVCDVVIVTHCAGEVMSAGTVSTCSRLASQFSRRKHWSDDSNGSGSAYDCLVSCATPTPRTFNAAGQCSFQDPGANCAISEAVGVAATSPSGTG